MLGVLCVLCVVCVVCVLCDVYCVCYVYCVCRVACVVCGAWCGVWYPMPQILKVIKIARSPGGEDIPIKTLSVVLVGVMYPSRH